MEKHTSLQKKDRSRSVAHKRQTQNPASAKKNVKRLKQSTQKVPSSQGHADVSSKALVQTTDIFAEMPEPDPAIKIVEVNLARAPVTKKDHDYRPVMFAGCRDLEARLRVEEQLQHLVGPLTNSPDHRIGHSIVSAKAAWFDPTTISAIEKSSLPEFFDDRNKAKTPEVYKSYRDYMIDTYRATPQQYLSNVECRRGLPGDLCSIFRVHAFLEYWGLINYGLAIKNQPKPSRLLLPHTDAHYFVLSEKDDGTIQPAEPIRDKHKSLAAHVLDLHLDEHHNELGLDSAAEPNEVDVGTLGIRHKDIELDKNQSIMLDSREWTDREVLRLMKAVEMYKDDWNKVGEYVGSRNQDECLLYFLRLPIEEKFTEESSLPHRDDVIPFSKTSNPVAYTMTFLASAVEPRVAACAAKAALEVFSHVKEEKGADTEPEKIVQQHIRDIKAAMGVADAGSSHSTTTTADNEETSGVKFNDSSVIKLALDKALEAAARKSYDLAESMELKIKALVALVLDVQMKKLDIKMNYYESLDKILVKETRQLETQRKKLRAAREMYHQSVLNRYGLKAKLTAAAEDFRDEVGLNPTGMDGKPADIIEAAMTMTQNSVHGMTTPQTNESATECAGMNNDVIDGRASQTADDSNNLDGSCLTTDTDPDIPTAINEDIINPEPTGPPLDNQVRPGVMDDSEMATYEAPAFASEHSPAEYLPMVHDGQPQLDAGSVDMSSEDAQAAAFLNFI